MLESSTIRIAKRHIGRIDAEGLVALFSKIIALEVLDLRGQEVPDMLRQAVSDLLHTFRRVPSESFGRAQQRHGLEATIAEMFAPLRAQYPDDPVPNLIARDLLRIARGEHPTSRSPHYRIGIVFDETYQGSGARIHREIQDAMRTEVQIVVCRQEVMNNAAIFSIGQLTPKSAAILAAAEARGIAVALISPGPLADGLDMPTFDTAPEAISFIRAQFRLVDDPEWSGRLHGEAVSQLSDILRGREAHDLRQALIESNDRRAATDTELIKLASENGLRNQFFDIYANGYRQGHNPIAAQRLNAARLEIERLTAIIATKPEENGYEPS